MPVVHIHIGKIRIPQISLLFQEAHPRFQEAAAPESARQYADVVKSRMGLCNGASARVGA